MKKIIQASCIVKEVGAISLQHSVKIPLMHTTIPAGFPSPADDYVENKLDLNEHLIKHPAATFFVRVEGNSMVNAGIQSGDMLIVDRALPVYDNSVVVAHINGEFTVKRIAKINEHLYLMPENNHYPPVLVTAEMNVEIWGVVVYAIHKV